MDVRIGPKRWFVSLFRLRRRSAHSKKVASVVFPRTNPAWFAGRNSATLPSFTVKLAMAAAALTARENSKEEISHAQSAANQSTSSFGNFPSKKPVFSLLWRTAREFLLIFFMGVWTCLVAWNFRRLAARSSLLTILVLVAGPKVPVPTSFLDGSAEVEGVLLVISYLPAEIYL